MLWREALARYARQILWSSALWRPALTGPGQNPCALCSSCQAVSKRAAWRGWRGGGERREGRGRREEGGRRREDLIRVRVGFTNERHHRVQPQLVHRVRRHSLLSAAAVSISRPASQNTFSSTENILLCRRCRQQGAPSPTLSPTDPVRRGLLTLEKERRGSAALNQGSPPASG